MGKITEEQTAPEKQGRRGGGGAVMSESFIKKNREKKKVWQIEGKICKSAVSFSPSQ